MPPFSASKGAPSVLYRIMTAAFNAAVYEKSILQGRRIVKQRGKTSFRKCNSSALHLPGDFGRIESG
jgi:hypothetical protein